MDAYPKAESNVTGPVVAQPTVAPVQPGGWMQTPAVQPNCPKGLECLCGVDSLMIRQKLEFIEAFTGYETNNKYEVLNSFGQRLFYAAEDTCCCTRNCCGSSRPFDIKILSNTSQEVMHLSRGLRCSSCWFPCCLQKVTVEAPPGNIIGYIAQAWSLCKPLFKIQNASGENVLQIKGPCCAIEMCGDVEFNIQSLDETQFVGRLTKQWSGLVKEIFTDADNFGISFPLDMDVQIKAVLLGAVFLIDFMYFEKDEKPENDHHSHSSHSS